MAGLCTAEAGEAEARYSSGMDSSGMAGTAEAGEAEASAGDAWSLQRFSLGIDLTGIALGVHGESQTRNTHSTGIHRQTKSAAEAGVGGGSPATLVSRRNVNA